MSDSPVVLSVENLGKRYALGGLDMLSQSFREMIMNTITAPFRRYKTLSGQVNESELFWALKDINFQVKQGEVVGIIGKNGAGKSTLLKILSRITTPTEGRVTITGNVASLLEVGTGFHPELTGRENIYLNGAILGMRRKEITRKFSRIVEFANIEAFVDTPVKRYSSGMYVRLAFSIAAHLDPDILIIDEILAVGDIEFQKRCLGKLNDVASEGRTVLFVSHNMNSVTRLCNRCIFLQSGQIMYDGTVADAISLYLDISKNKFDGIWRQLPEKIGTPNILKCIKLTNRHGTCKSIFGYSESIRVNVNYSTNLKDYHYVVGFRLIDAQGIELFTTFDTDGAAREVDMDNSYAWRSASIAKQTLKPGEYVLFVFLNEISLSGAIKHLDYVNLSIEILEDDYPFAKHRRGIIAPVIHWENHYE